MFRNDHLRRRCCGCALLVLVVALLVTLFLGFGVAWGVRAAHAAPARELLRATLLAPAVPVAAPAAQSRGVFYQQTISITVTAAPVWLAAAPDVRASLCVDDQATLTFTRRGHPPLRWSHRFSSADHRRIECLPPQEISTWLHPGQYQVAVTLEDHYPPRYSAQPLYLVLADEARASAAATPTRVPPATAVRAGRTPPAVPALTAPVVGASRMPPVLSTPIAPLSVRAPPATTSFAMEMLAAFAGVGALLGCVAVVRRATGRSPPPLSGIVDLTDVARGTIATVLLDHYPHGAAIVAAPLGLSAWSPHQRQVSAGMCVAYLLPRDDGAVLRRVGAANNGADDVRLAIGEVYALANGAITMRLRA